MAVHLGSIKSSNWRFTPKRRGAELIQPILETVVLDYNITCAFGKFLW